jgi:hypothetical protein
VEKEQGQEVGPKELVWEGVKEEWLVKKEEV